LDRMPSIGQLCVVDEDPASERARRSQPSPSA
jgi:hypothetical protein